MDYGQTLDSNLLSRIPFGLPPLQSDAEQAQLARLRRASERNPLAGGPVIRVGVPIWGEPRWVGSLYPSRTKSTEFIRAYQRQFRTVEINSSFYAVPTPATFTKWASMVGPDFRFCPKFPKSVSHHLFNINRTDLEHFYQGLEPMKERIGVTFLQLPQTFTSELGDRYCEKLLTFLDSVPRWVKPAVEFRNRAFVGPDHHLPFGWIDALSERFTATVLIDTPLEREAFHTSLTAPRVMVRFLGADLHETDWKRLDEWAERSATWIENGLQELYFVVHEPENLHAPEAARYLIRRLNETFRLRRMGIEIPEPQFEIHSQGSLL
jgi:uncharacterized protein YecE (DUF72 family)